MNYAATYCALITKRLNNPITKDDCYCETHHIIPKSEGGLDEKDNLVNLTAREHYIAHLLLARIYDDCPMWCAVKMMGVSNKRDKGRHNHIGSRLYDHAKKEAARHYSQNYSGVNSPNYGRKASQETRMKLSNALRGKSCSTQTKRKISLAHTGMRHSEQTKEKLRLANIGKKLSDEHKRRFTAKGRKRTPEEIERIILANNKTKGVSVKQYTLDGELVATYPSVHSASRAVGCTPGAITYCCQGRCKTVKGYVFKRA